MMIDAEGQCAPTPRPPSQIENAKSDLHEVVSRIEDTIDELESRFGNILMGRDDAKDNPPQPGQVLVPLANDLRDYIVMCSRCLNKLRSILDRSQL